VKMGKIRVQIKAPFGEIVVEGDSAQEILATLKTMPPEFMSDIGNLISAKLTPPIKEAHPLRSHRTNPVCFRRKNQHSHPHQSTAGFKRNQIHGAGSSQRNDEAGNSV